MKLYFFNRIPHRPHAHLLKPRKRRVITDILDDDKHWDEVPLVEFGDIWDEEGCVVVKRSVEANYSFSPTLKFLDGNRDDHYAELK